MDVPVTELQAHLGEWLDRVRGGAEVIITDSHACPSPFQTSSATSA